LGKIVTLTEAATIVGKTVPTIRDWANRGMKVVQRGSKASAWSIDMADLLAFREEQAAANAVGDLGDIDLDALKRRRMIAETRVAEIDAALRSGEVCLIADAAKTWATHIAACRAKLIGIPPKLAPQMVATTNLVEARDALDREINSALDELGDGGGEPDGDDG
jgi:phage terminase Nu1 subunit (DNA packaging protein)